jgi:putative tryptophan/tyrosine transport system substrate-binding protein
VVGYGSTVGPGHGWRKSGNPHSSLSRRPHRATSLLAADEVIEMRRRELLLLVAAAMTAARSLGAQQKAARVIGYLSSGYLSSGGWSPSWGGSLEDPLLQGLAETGYVEGQNVVIEYRLAKGSYDRLPAMAADLVSRKVEVIVAGGNPAAQAAKNATRTIPIVFTGVGDPVRIGLVASLARPGSNLTGVSEMTIDLMAKRLELLSELVPQATVIALLVNPTNADARPYLQEVQEAGGTKGVKLPILTASNESEIDAAFGTLSRLHAGALIVIPDAFFVRRRDQIVALASRYGVPAIYHLREFPAAGGLISYGVSLTANRRQAGIYVGRILKGENPADLPVQQPTKFEMVLNLKTAKALGLTSPPSILARADEVIE